MIADALSRLRDVMQQAEVDIMIVDHGELLAWLTGYTVSETLYRACLVPLTGAPWMVLRQLDEAPCRSQSPQLVVESYRDDEDPWFAVAHSLTRRGFLLLWHDGAQLATAVTPSARRAVARFAGH